MPKDDTDLEILELESGETATCLNFLRFFMQHFGYVLLTCTYITLIIEYSNTLLFSTNHLFLQLDQLPCYLNIL